MSVAVNPTRYKATPTGIDRVDTELQRVEATTLQTISDLERVAGIVIPFPFKRISTLDAAVVSINTTLAYLTAGTLKLTAGVGGTTWALADQAGYPNIGLLVVDTVGETGNILTLPASPTDKYEINVKIIDATGDLTLAGNGKDILTYSSGSGSYLLPRIGADTTIYGVRIKYYAADNAWHIISTAVGA